MCYVEESTLLVRGLIGDFVEPYTYQDSRIFDMFLYGARIVVQEIVFNPQYSVSLNKTCITPTPDDDSPLIVLGALKAACIIANSEYKAYIGGAVQVVDGPSSINTGGQATEMAKRANKACSDYEQAKMQFALGNTDWFGAILTPTTSPGNPINGYCYRNIYS